jgi:hypothetical protein
MMVKTEASSSRAAMIPFGPVHATVETIVIGGLPAYLAMQIWALLALRDGCRFAALLPVLLGISLIASAFDGLSSHLGPSAATLMFFAPAAMAYLAGLTGFSALIHRIHWFDPTQDLATR